MAKPKENSKELPGGAKSPARFVRYCLICLLSVAVVLAWLSMLTFSPNDWPSPRVYSEPPQPVENAAGVIGAFVAWQLRFYLGGGAYMALLFASVAAIILMCGGRVGDLPWRIMGVALLTVSTSAAAYVVNPGSSDLGAGSSGVVGTAAGDLLLRHLHKSGAWVVVLFALGAGLMLTADNLVLQLPRLGKKAWSKRGGLPNVVSILRPGAGADAARAATPAAAKPKSEKTPIDPPAAKPAPGRVSITAPPQAQATKEDSTARPAAKPLIKPQPAASAKSDSKPKAQSDRKYVLPDAELLAEPAGSYMAEQEAAAQHKRAILQQTLNDFSVQAEVVSHMTGPVITLFELSLAPGVKVAQVSNLATDMARALAVPGVRIVSPLPGRDTVGVEVPNLKKEIVRIKELMNMAPEADRRMYLPLYLGKDAGGGAIIADLARMPHMLIAGTTGSGKSVCINTIIMSLLLTRTPEQVRFILVDPKMVEMAAFENIPHLLCPIVNDMRRAEDILEWAATKMDERYELLKEAGVKNIAGYNALSKDEIYNRFQVENEEEKARVPTKLPYYVIIIDELADLIMTSTKEVEGHIIRIAQKARAVGIHLILATQRPSVNVVTGLIKSNMPCRISFRVASRQESRIVLDQNGADVLLGQGDMLFLQPGTSNLVRSQGTFVDDSEIRTVVDELRKTGEPQYNGELMKLGSASVAEGLGERDELFDQAVEIVLASQRGSVSLLQRRLQVGYSRASRIIDQMAEAGILGDYKGSQARECLMTLEDWQTLQASIAADQSGESALNGEPTSV